MNSLDVTRLLRAVTGFVEILAFSDYSNRVSVPKDDETATAKRIYLITRSIGAERLMRFSLPFSLSLSSGG